MPGIWVDAPVLDTFSALRSLNFLDLRGSRITAAREDREALMAST
jgi:hypothetical protein